VTDATDHLRQLAATAEALRVAERQAEVERRRLDVAIRYARDDGVPMTEIADVAGISRETAYKALAREDRRGERFDVLTAVVQQARGAGG
jgi:CRP-like cAMP-binding protein